ncbi:chaperone protein [Colletotrichum sojae]|uniref:Chaperone protein n=1 Tax=Colletotrichum sojae TaxID=2175907 RepID=A0A8H6J1N7_9PEZI|nr:chaperone protein [Colletotrichum sojae]
MAPPSSRDYYADLGVPPSATAEQIKSAYHKLVLKHHPDKQAPGSRPDSEDFRRIQEAWECIGDKKKRAAFDKTYQRIRKSSAGVRKDQSADVPLGGRSYVSPAAMAEWKETLRKLAEEEIRPAREQAAREEQERGEQAARDEAAQRRAELERICREKRRPAKEAKIEEQKWRDKMSEYPIHEWSAELYRLKKRTEKLRHSCPVCPKK